MNIKIGKNIIMNTNSKNTKLNIIFIFAYISIFAVSNIYAKIDNKEETCLKRLSIGFGVGEEYNSLVKIERFHSWGNIEYLLLKRLFIKLSNTPFIIYGQRSIGVYCFGCKYFVLMPIFIEGGFGFSLADKIHNISEDKKYGYGWFSSIGYSINISKSVSLSPEIKYYGSYIDTATIYILGIGIGFYYHF